MAIGLSTYAFQWRGSEAAAHPVDLFGMIDETIELGGTVLQICDYPAIETMSDDELVVVRDYAIGSGVKLELGTRGIATAHLMRYLELALILDASFVRSMLHVPDLTPSATESIDLLRTAIPEFASNDVTLGLETYELVPTSELVDIVAAVDSRFLGICLDPANSVARLEMPSDTINSTASRVVNLHVKDFSFTRSPGWVGFHLVGCPLGSGLLPFDEMMAAVRPEERGVNLIVEHWVPPAGSLEETCEIEREWTRHSAEFLTSRYER